MSSEIPATHLQLHSTIREDATLELCLAEVPVPEPGENDVLVRVEAAPINPSDMGVLFGPADMTTASAGGSPERPIVTAEVPAEAMAGIAARVGQPIACGNEGAGVVVKTGTSESARALKGRTVAILGGAMYAEYRLAPVAFCLPLPEGTTPREGAAPFVNPLTALGMLETMKREGHSALVHTAAASNLGQMLVKLCLADGVPLVNVVRREEHVALLRGIGAKHVVDSSRESFETDLTDAIAETNATLAFDATGGGRLASRILEAMEAALSRSATEFSRYGSDTHKQVYLYGRLDRSPAALDLSYGMAWGVGGWLLPNFLRAVGSEVAGAMRARVARDIKTIFASRYTKDVSLAEALSLENLAAYGAQATGEKFLVTPGA